MTDRELDALPARSVAVVRAFRRPLNRSLLIGGATSVIVVTVLVAVGAYQRLTWEITPLLLAAFGGLVGLIVAIAVLPQNIRRAFEAYSWLGHAEVERFKERTGGPVPTKIEDMRAWIEANPPTPAFLLPRIEILAFLGRYAEARAELDSAAVAEPDSETAFELATLRQYIDWLETASTDLSGLKLAAAAIPAGSEARRASAVSIAVSQARIQIMAGDPAWTASLEAVRTDLGRAPWRATLADTWRPVGLLFGAVGLIAALIVPLLQSTL
jgi:hypothetical protein